MVFGYDGEENKVFRTVVLKIMGVSHGAVMHLSGQDRFLFAVAIKRSLAAQHENHLTILLVFVQSACSSWFQYVAHNAAFVVYKGAHDQFTVSTLKTNDLCLFQII